MQENRRVKFKLSKAKNDDNFMEEFDSENSSEPKESSSKIEDESLDSHDGHDSNNPEDGDDDNSSDNSDLSLIIFKKGEQKIIRKSKILRRRNIHEIENNEAKRKLQEKMVIPHAVVEKIEKNELELNKMINDATCFIGGNYLVLSKNEREQEWTSDNVNQDIKSKVNDTLNKINRKFIEIDDGLKKTSKKEDKLVKYEDISKLRAQCLQLLKEKDDIIHSLREKLDEMSFQLINEASSNSNALINLEEIAKSQITILKDEHEKQNIIINKLYEDEKLKKDNRDSTQWKLLLDNIISKIPSMTLSRLSSIKEKDIELKKLYKIHEKEIKKYRIAHVKSKIGIDADLKMCEIRCSDNVKKFKYNCSILKRKIDEDSAIVVDLGKRIVALQETKCDLKEKLKKIEIEHEIQIPIIKKQIFEIDERFDQKEKTADLIAKKNNCQYIQLWRIQQNNFIDRINEIHRINNIIQEFLGIIKTQIPKKNKTVVEELPTCWKPHNIIQESILNDFTSDSSYTNTYVYARDKDYNKLLINFILKNSSFVFDYNANEVFDTNLMHNLPYLYDVLRLLKLNKEDTWNLMKSKLKPFVMCRVCKTNINWEFDENMINTLEQEKCTIAISENYTEKCQTKKSVLENLSTHIIRHYDNIDRVKKIDSVVYQFNDVQLNTDIFQNTKEKINEEYPTTIVNNDTTAKNVHLCGNVNHELFIDNKYFMPILIEVIKTTQFKSNGKTKSLDEILAKKYDFIEWKLNENDLIKYWSTFIEFIPSATDPWNMFHQTIKRYYNVLFALQNKLLKISKLKNNNEEMRTILSHLEGN